jgi:hypothetical protein
VHPADPLGSLTPAEVPLIEAEKLSEQAGPPHKFSVGQLVYFHPDRGERASAPPGLYEVTKQLPHDGHEHEYRIKSQREEHERTAKESQLSSA